MAEALVRDVMVALEHYVTIDQNSTLLQALTALKRSKQVQQNLAHHHRAALVVNQEMQVVGKLSHWAILRALEPRLRLKDPELVASVTSNRTAAEVVMSERESLSFFSGSLDKLSQNAATVTVRHVMVPIHESIHQDAPLTRAISQLVLKRAQSILVTNGTRVVGILRLADVCDQVIERVCSDV